MTTTTSVSEEAQLRERLDALARALRAKDLPTLMAHYAPDVVTFDLQPPLQIRGVDAYRRNFEKWFTSVQGPIEYEIRELHIAVKGDIAHAHYLGHVQCTRKTGEKADYWVRVTAGLQKLNGHWSIAHEHVSMPVNMETMQAAV